jgi:hypothetical protein
MFILTFTVNNIWTCKFLLIKNINSLLGDSHIINKFYNSEDVFCNIRVLLNDFLKIIKNLFNLTKVFQI